MSRRTLPVLSLSIFMLGGWACWAAVRVPEAQAKKAAVVKPLPVLSPMCRQLRVTGRVELEVHISEGGEVESVKTVMGNPMLAVDATNAVKRWKFEPFTEGGAPAKAVTNLSFDFKQ
jgi:TonB family protein